MASVPYNPTPDTAPDTRVPDDFQRVDASPASFGSTIAQGAEQLGAGASKAGEFFGQASVDDQINHVMTAAQTIRYGDPTQAAKNPDGSLIFGADGTPQPDTGFLGKSGTDAMHGWQPALKQLDSVIAAGRQNLSTPEQQLQFDSQTRKLRSIWADEIGRHADEQSKIWMGTVSNAGAAHALNNIAAAPDDATSLAHNASDLINFRIKAAEAASGNSLSPDVKAQVAFAARQEALKAQINAVSVTDPARAMRILEKSRQLAGIEYEPLANGLRARADQAVSDAAADKALAAGQQHNMQQPAATGPGVANPAAVVRHFEGFRTNAYWDVNHWRVGYGSDTITNPDGSVSPVTAMTTVSRDDAERDLSRRTQQSQAHAETVVGPQAWERLSPQARASITSVTYNYGSLPDRLIGPIRSGDNQQIAMAIHNLGSDNGGVNAQRRAVEAANVVGKFGLSGVESMRGYASMLSMPPAVAGNYHPLLSAMTADAAATGPDQPPAWAGGLDAARTSLSEPPPAWAGHLDTDAFRNGPNAPQPAPPQATAQDASPAAGETAAPAPAPDPLMVKAAAFQAIENDPTLNEHQKEMAYAKISRQVQEQSIAEEADAKAKADMSEKVAGSYFERIENGQAKDIAPQIINDQRMKYETRHALLDLLERTSGDRNVRNFGPGYADAYRRIMAPDNDPQRIVDPLDLYRLGAPGGPLTMSGVGRLKGVLDAVRKNVDDAAVNTAKVSLIKYGGSKLSFDQEMMFPGTTPLKDPRGAQIFNAQFVPKFEAAYDAWLKAGKNPWEFLTQDNVDKMFAGLRSPSEMAAARIAAIGGEVGSGPQTPQPSAPLPPAPPIDGIDPRGWNSVVSRPAQPAGTAPNYAAWAAQLNKLVANPTPQTVRFFNDAYGRFGYDGNEVLRLLKVQPVMATPPRPPNLLDAPAPAPEPDLGRTANAIRSFNHWLSGHERVYGPLPETTGQKIGDFLMRRGHAGA